MKQVLVIGGTSGLGLELAKRHRDLEMNICIAGRNNPNEQRLTFKRIDISSQTDELKKQTGELLHDLPRVDTLIYSPGFYQEGHISDLTDEEILLGMNVNVIAATLLIRKILIQQKEPLKIIGITSSSEYTPREKEPIYTAAKAGLGMLLRSLSLDPNIRKVLTVAPSGMNTPFWSEKREGFLDPIWVADEIMKLSSGTFEYKYAKITKNPPTVIIEEERLT